MVLAIIIAGILILLGLEYKTAFLEIYLSGRWNVGADEIALTFDDCPREPYTSRILNILAEKGVKATFFIIGNRAEEYPEIVIRMVNDGHSIGNHGYTDKKPALFSQDGTASDILKTQDILRKITGSRPRLFRLPSGTPQRKIKNVVDREELKVIFATTLIHNERGETSEELISNITQNTHSGSIVLLHGDHEAVVGALPNIISKLKEKKLKFMKFNS